MKLEAKELRIGNIVINAGRRGSVQPLIGVESVSVSLLGIIATYPDNHEYEPIPLTEEWLLKFGFIRKHFDMKIKGLKLTASTRLVASDKLSAFHHKKVGFISSVHQLQNLYFALTGEELKPTL